MKATLTFVGVVAILLLTGALASSQMHAKQQQLAFATPQGAAFKEMMAGASMAGASMAVVWGDQDTGPYGAFVNFAPGFDAGNHVHTNDMLLVVIEGA